jgi:dihydroorotase
VNEGKIFPATIVVKDGVIEDILDPVTIPEHIPGTSHQVLDASGLTIFPGLIDDQVHFREPGMTHKGNIASESRAAVAGGVTSFLEMPNTKPPTISLEEIEWKHLKASETSLANFSFYLGATHTNLDQLLKADSGLVCGIKIFMGSSTGNLLVNDDAVLDKIFKECKVLIATHCEDDSVIERNAETIRKQYGDNPPFSVHPLIRSAEACLSSTAKAVRLAQKHQTRLHVLHISTADEIALFESVRPSSPRITTEACVHHLWFTDQHYEEKGASIKWNPAIKTTRDRESLRNAVSKGIIDIIATDHAPHTQEEKRAGYFQCPSGGPLVQHSLIAMMEMVKDGVFSLNDISEKMCHAPARIFGINKRGFIRKGYHADLAFVKTGSPWTVEKSNILYQCGWSPFEKTTFSSCVFATFVNGIKVYQEGKFAEGIHGRSLDFSR